MPRRSRDIVVIGASAGGIAATSAILSRLPHDFPAAVLIVLHRGFNAGFEDSLTRIFAQRSSLTTRTAGDSDAVESGHVYVAPVDSHMVVENGLIRLQHSPREQRFRPCIDVLFKSAAAEYGRRLIGVLLSGRVGNDGVAGLWHIRHRGGVTIIQDPVDAAFPGMPQTAIENVDVDDVLAAAEIGPRLVELTTSDGPAPVETMPRILIVEDESVVAANLQRSLGELGYDVLDCIATGEGAIQLAARAHPDLILMDIRLAGEMTGIEAARHIWQTMQIPVVYCTAHADLETLRAVQTTESYGYVVKPFSSAAVHAAVELALGRREKELR
ncbi:MAG TPA: chemotaxis protein CheB [Vicinamibacterales bacterium]|nr:chemotaxis protein CheB [Vicinamibacterales bacterium]